MASRRAALAGVAAAALFADGLGAAWTLAHGDLAASIALVLLALWIGTAWAWSERRPRTAPSTPPPSALETAQAELRVLANLLDQAPAPMLTLHADGGVRAANRAARRLFSAEDRLGDPPQALLDAFAAGAGEARRLTVDLGASERRKTYAMSASDFVGPRGVRRLAVLLDIEPELLAAEAAALRELMGVLDHEIMNGLTPIASLAATAAELLAELPPGADAGARDAVSTIARRSEGLSRFVAAYRALAHLPPPVVRPTSLGALLDETAALFRARWSASGVALAVHRPIPDAICEIDEELLVRALTNLLTNAAEAALETTEAEPRVALAACADASGAVLSVSDNGLGVAKDDRERIFQAFYTRKTSGAGIGLSLARQIARSHGGDLRLRSDTMGGAHFEIIL